MKRIVCFVVSLLLLAGVFVSCEKREQKRVISTVFVGYDLARQLVGDDARMLLPTGMEAHSYEPSVSDMIEIGNCELFIYVGGESEDWVETLLVGEHRPKRVLRLMDYVELLEEDHEHHHQGKVAYDEHIWTSPKNTAALLDAITNALCELDVEREAEYRLSSEAYKKELLKLDGEFEAFFESLNNKTLVFGDRFPLRYFADRYDIDYYSAYEGCSGEAEPSAATVSFLVDKIKEENIPVVFFIEMSDRRIANNIAEATDTETRLFHTCHNVSRDELENGETYLSLMKKNLETLREVLS